jgi:predicted nucleic acid-binding protein
MTNWESFFHQTKSIEDIINEAVIVVDTNVLLSAYQWREVTVKEVVRVLTTLSDQGRLKIPLQVVQEFSRNRTKELIQRVNDIEDIISRLQLQKPLNEKVPMLEGREIFDQTTKKLGNLNNSIKEYKSDLLKVRDEIKELFTNDPYLEQIKKILQSSFYELPETAKKHEEILNDAKLRFKENRPPGYKDNPKEENSAGDYVIWYYILQLKGDVIFISGDKKPDWVYSDKHGNPISARRELVEEFYIESGGFDFVHLTPKEFITLLNPQVSDDIKTDLSANFYLSKNNIIRKDKIIYTISDVFFKYDPENIIYDKEAQWDEYVSEARLLYKKIDSITSINQLSVLIKNIFKKMFETDLSSFEHFDSMVSDIYSVIQDFKNPPPIRTVIE